MFFFQIKIEMTEADVFNVLLRNEKVTEYNFDFPKQQSETVKKIARNLTELIYESYIRKSSTSKRYQILKFINNVCEIPEPHVYEDYMKCVVKQVNQFLPSTENEEVTIVVKEIALDLESKNQEKFSRYYEKKIAREKEKQNRIDSINKKNQEKLNKKYHLSVKEKYFFEPNENLLKKVLGIENIDFSLDSDIKNALTINDNRDAQIKLAYGMINMGQTEILTRILHRISSYEVLSETERNFLQYIWSTQYDRILDIGKLIHIFYFLLEEILFKHATKLLDLTDENEVYEYFVKLENNCDIIKVKNTCKQDHNCYLKLRTLLYELYCISHCNDNVMKLSEIIM